MLVALVLIMLALIAWSWERLVMAVALVALWPRLYPWVGWLEVLWLLARLRAMLVLRLASVAWRWATALMAMLVSWTALVAWLWVMLAMAFMACLWV